MPVLSQEPLFPTPDSLTLGGAILTCDHCGAALKQVGGTWLDGHVVFVQCRCYYLRLREALRPDFLLEMQGCLIRVPRGEYHRSMRMLLYFERCLAWEDKGGLRRHRHTDPWWLRYYLCYKHKQEPQPPWWVPFSSQCLRESRLEDARRHEPLVRCVSHLVCAGKTISEAIEEAARQMSSAVDDVIATLRKTAAALAKDPSAIDAL
jgi:hypothetical protein